MKRFLPYCFLMIGLFLTVFGAQAQNEVKEEVEEVTDSLIIVDPMLIYESLPTPELGDNYVSASFFPKIFVGYRKIHSVPDFARKTFSDNYKGLKVIDGNELINIEPGDTIAIDVIEVKEEIVAVVPDSVAALPDIMTYNRPTWLTDALITKRNQEELLYVYMLNNPSQITAAYWDLPSPPVLLEDDTSFMAFLRRQELPEISPEDSTLPEPETKEIHWLHKFGTQLQFSQAYVSPNWYQGGNNYLSMLFNFNWNVQLNQVYHPNLLFQSDLSYKVAFSSNPKGYAHKYTIAEDNFQYNLNTGLKAAKNWYYSFNLQFKTQFFNNFEENSDKRTAAFLSPGDLNLGLGMSYNHANKLKTFQLTLTISPLSYNLKTCIKPNDVIDHAAYGIPADKNTKSEIGSNVDLTMDWKMTANISYKTRLFMFTDYHYFLADWQNTFNFDINKFLSTQLFVHLRYDGSAESYGRWKKFMLREILSFGLSYTFSTKP